jgi:uncharacterized membrane protein YhaH (DUF805 family)
MEEYFDGWRNFINTNDNTNRKQFWIFFGVNFSLMMLFFYIVEEILKINISVLFPELFFWTSLIAIGIRRMNDLEQPWYFLFIPFYNFYLLVQKGKFEYEENTIEVEQINLKTPLGVKSFFKIVLASIIIGVIYLITTLTTPGGENLDIHLMLNVFSIPVSLIIMLLFSVFSKSEITNLKIIFYVFCTLIIWYIFSTLVLHFNSES